MPMLIKQRRPDTGAGTEAQCSIEMLDCDAGLTRLIPEIAADSPVRGLMGKLAFADRERIRSFAIITTKPNELCADLHNRMPVVLKPEAWPEWLGEEPADETRLKSLLAPSARVGNVKNNDPSLIKPVAVA
jgi:hypothetical protein